MVNEYSAESVSLGLSETSLEELILTVSTYRIILMLSNGRIIETRFQITNKFPCLLDLMQIMVLVMPQDLKR